MKQKRKAVYKSGHIDYNALDAMRHSAVHLLAAAVMELWPKTRLGVGPTTENGFYYDFELPVKLTEADLAKIEDKMRELQKLGFGFERSVLGVDGAIKKLTATSQPFKIELVKDLRDEGETEISFYQSANFVDLCKGPHVNNVSEIGAFKLLSIAGAYWKGDEKNKMLTRIYGTCFPTQEELDHYIWQVEEAKKCDHKRLGRELNLFLFSPEVGPGLSIYTPKGWLLRHTLEAWLTVEKQKRGYQFVWTPHIAKSDLYRKSKHWQKYEAMMNPITIENEEYVIKPMNCPHHFQIYLDRPRSYRELPLRIAENATVYRYEKTGELNGLLRVRALTQDDTHTFVRHSQIAEEIDRILDLTTKVYQTFGFSDYRARISTRDQKNPEKFLGNPKTWDKAEKALIGGVKKRKLAYFIGDGEAAFYGPKIDVMVKDALGREWQLTTIQLDFTQPENFDMNYVNENGKLERPAVLHIAVLGAFERFIAVLVEHYAGAFPLWLAPVQIVVIPIAERHVAEAKKVKGFLAKTGIRVEVDSRSDTMQAKIRDATLQKVPYMGIIGDRETASGKIALRLRSGEERKDVSLESLLRQLQKEIETKA